MKNATGETKEVKKINKKKTAIKLGPTSRLVKYKSSTTNLHLDLNFIKFEMQISS
jgi:hypothetical protein